MGYHFVGWDSAVFTWTFVTASATIRAQYEPIPTSTTVERGLLQQPIAESLTPSATAAEEFRAAALLEGIPAPGVPLYAPANHVAWALLNLILAALGAVLALVFFAVRSIKRPQTKGKNDSQEGQSERQLRSLGWIIGSAALALGALLLFLFAQDIRLPLVWTDGWTIWHFLLFAALTSCGFMSIRSKKSQQTVS